MKQARATKQAKRRKLPKPTVELPVNSSFDLTKQCRLHTELAVNTLIKILRSKKVNGSTKVKAAQEILNRAYGKAPIIIDITQHLDTEALASAATAILEERRRKLLLDNIDSDSEKAPPMNADGGVGIETGSHHTLIPAKIPAAIPDKKIGEKT